MKRKILVSIIIFVISFFCIIHTTNALDIYGEYKTGGTHKIIANGQEYSGTLYTEMKLKGGSGKSIPVNRIMVDQATVEGIVKTLANNTDNLNIGVDGLLHKIMTTFKCSNNDSLTLTMNFNSHSLSNSTYYFKNGDPYGTKLSSTSSSYKEKVSVMEGGQEGKDLFYVDKKYSVKFQRNIPLEQGKMCIKLKSRKISKKYEKTVEKNIKNDKI